MNHVVAVPLDPKLAEYLGKKGSVNGLTFYNRKSGDDVLVTLAPTDISDKFYSVAEALLIADQVVISTASVDALLGEMLVACSLLKKRVLITSDNDISNILSSKIITDYEIVPKEELLDKLAAFKPQAKAGDVRVDIDKAFPVKGIGTVILGVVTSGIVKVHDNLYHSSGKQVSIRSMQSQDVDINEAGFGVRVGIAVKGIEHDEIDKGDLLTAKQVPKVKTVNAKLNVSKVGGGAASANETYTFVSNFSRSMAWLDEQAGKIDLEKPLAVSKDDAFLLIREKVPRIFASGVITG